MVGVIAARFGVSLHSPSSIHTTPLKQTVRCLFQMQNGQWTGESRVTEVTKKTRKYISEIFLKNHRLYKDIWIYVLSQNLLRTWPLSGKLVASLLIWINFNKMFTASHRLCITQANPCLNKWNSRLNWTVSEKLKLFALRINFSLSMSSPPAIQTKKLRRRN